MKKIFFLLFMFCSGIAFSQINLPTSHEQSKWRVGGNIGLSFGNNNYFGLAISPSIGYKITREIEGGITAGYRYSKWSHSKQNMFNVGPYINYYPINSIFLRSHYEYYTGNQKYDNIVETRNFNESALWVGGGYRSGGPVKIYVGLMYNVLYKKDHSVFANGLRPIGGVSISI